MRYRLRTLLILLAVGPPVLAGAWFGRQLALARYEAWQWQEAIRCAKSVSNYGGG
jgi:hypothetical protein